MHDCGRPVGLHFLRSDISDRSVDATVCAHGNMRRTFGYQWNRFDKLQLDATWEMI